MFVKKRGDQLSSKMLQTMQPVLNTFSEMLGVWLKFVDISGRYIITAQNVRPCNFCQTIRAVPRGLERCHHYAREAVNQSKNEHGPFKSICHAGLITVTVPIMVDDSCFGALMAGEIVQGPAEEIKREVLKRTADLPLDLERLINCFQELPVWEPRKVDILAQTLYAISNCFIELGVASAREEKMELIKALREAELRALQAQINPHFLFNTLNTIEMLAMMEGARQTTQIVHSLAQILRHNLFSKTELTTLASELESINHYLLIQQCRFGERLRVLKNVPPELLQARIPALTLQPLVENAVVHGLEPLERPGILEITGEAVNDHLIFVIKDNGVGIPEHRLNDLRSRIMELKSNTDTLGLVNIQKRCRLLYGPGYGITITSVWGKGTEVRLKLPKSTKTGGVSGEAAYC